MRCFKKANDAAKEIFLVYGNDEDLCGFVHSERDFNNWIFCCNTINKLYGCW